MSGVRIVLILTGNWTMRPTPDEADLVQFAVEAERAGLDAVMVSEHVAVPGRDRRDRLVLPVAGRAGGGAVRLMAARRSQSLDSRSFASVRLMALIGAVLYFGVRVSVRSQLVLALVSIVVVTIFFIVVIVKLGSANSVKPFNPSSSGCSPPS